MLELAINFCMENHFYMLGGEVKRQAQVKKLAEVRVGRVDTLPSQGLIFKSRAAQMACEVGFLRRRLSFAAVQSQARLPLLQLQGDGAREAAGQRGRALAARRAESNEMRAQHASMLSGRNIRRSGFGLLD